MKIVIAGAGEVGSHLAKLLSREEQDIILIDNDPEKLAAIDANYNLMTQVGSPKSFRTLHEARVADCDLFIAVTPFEDCNVTSCGIAKYLGAKKTVARIDNYEFMESCYRDFFTKTGVNDMIYPEYLAAQEIKTALNCGWVRHWFELNEGELILIGVKVCENSQLIGRQLKDLTFARHNYHVSAIKRRHETIIPRGDDIIKVNDILYFMTTPEYVEELRKVCGKRSQRIRKIMVVGGSRIAVMLASMASPDWKIKIIDNDMEKCRRLPEKCPNCEIIFGDGRDNDLLLEERIGEMDAFIALTESSETNILACLAAKEFGVGKTVAEVENIQFISEAEALNIGSIINKKLLASSKIFQLLLDSDSTSSKCLALADAEVAQIEVKAGSKITRAAVKDLKLSRDMTIAGLVRDGHGQLVGGNTVIQAGDIVVVFCLSGALHKVERLFS